jgi:hypothetical protein
MTFLPRPIGESLLSLVTGDCGVMGDRTASPMQPSTTEKGWWPQMNQLQVGQQERMADEKSRI